MYGLRPRGVLCSGNVVYDILVRPVEELRWGTTAWVESITQQIGGNGANTSYALARLGAPVRLLSVVGKDAFGSLLLDILQGAGVDTQFVARAEAATPASVVLVQSSGARLFLHRPGAAAEALPEPIDFTAGLTLGLTHFHLANVYALPRMRAHAGESLRRARAAGLTTSLDTGWDSRGEWMRVLAPCLPYLDLLFVNEDEARMLTGTSDPARAAGEFLRQGAGTVVLKLGGKGCAVFNADGQLFSPACDVAVLDTTGAGDCFAGGFLAALHHGKTPAEAARFANAVGALSVQGLGAVTGLRSLEETERFLNLVKWL